MPVEIRPIEILTVEILPVDISQVEIMPVEIQPIEILQSQVEIMPVEIQPIEIVPPKMRMIITDDSVEIHFGLRLLDRAVDHKVTVIIIPVLTNRDRELRHLAVLVEYSEQHSRRRIREVDQ